MRVRAFSLCDKAVVRGQLLTIVNGGFNELIREDFPSVMACDLAISLEFDLTHARSEIPLSLDIETDIGEDFGLEPLVIDVDLAARPEDPLPTGSSPAIWHQVVEMDRMVLPSEGHYRMVLRSGDEVVTFMRFEARRRVPNAS